MAFLGAYAIAVALPAELWGAHAAVFLPSWAGACVAGLAAALWALTLYDGRPRRWLQTWASRSGHCEAESGRAAPVDASAGRSALMAAAIASAAAALAYALPIHMDPWGDAQRFMAAFEGGSSLSASEHLALVLSPDVLHPKVGERTILNLVALMPWDYLTGFRALGAGCAAVWVFTWLLFARRIAPDPLTRAVLGAIGVFAPWTMWFFGHIEVYGPALVAFGGFSMAAHLCVLTRSRRWLLALPLLLMLALKTHITAWLLVPIAGLCAVHHVRPQWITVRRLALGLWLPAVLGGAWLYFGVFSGWDISRIPVHGEPDVSRLVLPLSEPPPPYHRYSLLSGTHLVDFANQALLWSAPALLLLALLIGRGRARWTDPAALVSGTAALLFVAAFFVLNPLLGMALDSDLMSLPGPAVLVFGSVMAVRATDRVRLLARIAGPAAALCLLSVPNVWVNTSPDALSRRIERIAVGSFRGYWVRSAGTADLAMAVAGLTERQAQPRYRALIDELEPWATPQLDREYAHLLWRVASYHRRHTADLETAITFHERAADYDNTHGANVVGAVEAYFLAGRFAEAHAAARSLIPLRHPNPRRAGRIVIQMALAAGLRDEVAVYCQQYRAHWPQDALIERVQSELARGAAPEGLATLFSSPRPATSRPYRDPAQGVIGPKSNP